MTAKIWRKCKLRDIANIYRGGNFQKNDFIPEGKPCIHYGQMYTHFGTFTDKVLTYLPEDVFRKSRIAVSNDVVMAITSETVEDVCSCVAWVGKEDIAISGHTVIIHHQEDTKYLSYYFHSDSFFTQKSRVAHGSKVIEINPCDLENTIIVLPKDIQEQKRISDILSTCDTVIQNTQKTIDKYKAIKQGMMQDLFTRGLTKDGKLRPSYKEAPELYKESELGMIPKEWAETPVIEIGEVISGGTPFTKNTDFWDGNIPFVTPNDLSVNEGAYITSTERYITVLGLSKSSAIELPEGTLIISSRAPIGYLAIASFNCVTNQGCKSVVFDSKQAPLFHYYNFQRYVNKMKSLGSGTTFAEISKKDVEKVKVSYPLKDEQIAIAKRLSSIDSTIQKEEAVLEKYKNIKIGLMARLLTPPEDAEIIDETGE